MEIFFSSQRTNQKQEAMLDRQIFINAVMSAVHVIVLSFILFVLYRYLLVTIGVELLGIWSLVLATAGTTRIGEFGISSSVVKFVAKYRARCEDEHVAGVIQTALLSAGALIGLILLVAYPLISWMLLVIVHGTAQELTLLILPYALVSLWITVIASVSQAGLDGYQRIDLRSIVLMVSGAFHLLLCFMLVPAYGLLGLAFAQIIQSLMVLIASWCLLKRQLHFLPWIPFRWHLDLFREMVRYGFNFQVASVATMLYDPVTKGLLTNFGGLAMVGYYEMASRMIIQLRALIMSASQALVPFIADLQEKTPEFVQDVYKASYSLIVYLALPFYSIIIAVAPLVSEIWLGSYERIFVIFSALLAFGWFLNVLNAPAYFANLGIGELHSNTSSHLIMGLSNLVLGLALGKFYGGIGVVIAWSISLTIGSTINTVLYHLTHKIPLSELLPRQSSHIALASGLGLLVAMIIYYQMRHLWSLFVVYNVIALAFLVIVGVPIWLHPMRKRLIGWTT